MEFFNTLIHCSSIGKLLTEPISKADKESGELSKTAKTHLIEVYANKKYGFKKKNLIKVIESNAKDRKSNQK